MKLRRNNVYLESLLDKCKIEYAKFQTGGDDLENLKQKLQSFITNYNKTKKENGDVFIYPFEEMIIDINAFTSTWSKPNNATFTCDKSKINKPNVDISIESKIESYLN